MSTRRACDRCYRYKEKCYFEFQSTKCGQCSRSGSSCTTLRSQPRQGRRPKVKHLGPNSSVQVWAVETNSETATDSQDYLENHVPSLSDTSSESELAVSHPIYQIPSLSIPRSEFDDPEDLRNISSSHIQRFYAFYHIFMLGPTFAGQQRAAFSRSYVGSPLLLRESFMAISQAVGRAKQLNSFSEKSDIAYGACSLQKLRTARIIGIDDALAIITLGQTLAAFDIITNCVGASLILRYSLSSAQPWYAELSRDPLYDAITITPIFWDTICCLFRREIPVIKFQPRVSGVVDRLAGLCTSLLPILYDLCVASHQCQSLRYTSSGDDFASIRRLEQRLLAWTPEEPDNFTDTFSKQEVLGMKTQAGMYQKAGLLIAHRIMNPIGTQDDIARWYANSITLEFLNYPLLGVTPVGELNTKCVVPILLAALEIPNVPREAWENIALLNVAPVCSAKMKAFVGYVWKRRRRGYQGFLLDLVDEGPDFVVTP